MGPVRQLYRTEERDNKPQMNTDGHRFWREGLDFDRINRMDRIREKK
jgi:hypothetical protein